MGLKISLKKIEKRAFGALPFVLCAVSILLAILLPRGRETVTAEEKRVVTVWNVDTFEGGRGSRTSFLKKVARRVEKRLGNAYFLISSYTVEGAEAALAEGIRPDALSFGVGLSAFAEYSLPISYSFAGGETEDGCLAYPWCRGEYALFSMTGDFSAAGETAVSCGGSNLGCVAAAYAGITGEEVESLAAYTEFLSGKYRYLLGTQRDVCRFEARGVQVYSKPLPEYCDLYQYFSVLSAEKRDLCTALLEELLSQETQSALSEIGMNAVEGGTASRTVSVFASNESLAELCAQARQNTDAKNLDKYLKMI